jgi:hypothetical protein
MSQTTQEKLKQNASFSTSQLDEKEVSDSNQNMLLDSVSMQIINILLGHLYKIFAQSYGVGSGIYAPYG